MKIRGPALLTALLVVTTACAAEVPTDQPVDLERVSEGGVQNETTETAAGGVDEKKPRKPGEDKERKRGGEPPQQGSAGGGGDGGGSGDEDGDEGPSAKPGSGSRRSSPSAYPAAGTYTFAQSGYEEFCDGAGRCDKQDLPARQPTKLSYGQRGGDSAVVVTEQASGARVARTWMTYTPSGAHITKLYVRMVYSGFSFERTYVPQPAVEAFRFPFREGSTWSGRWKAQTSGTYSVRVGSATQVDVGGRAVTAYPVDTTTTFTGDFEGRSRIKAFVDPKTKAIVASEGVLNVTSRFGRYSTVFETRLLGGPGY